MILPPRSMKCVDYIESLIEGHKIAQISIQPAELYTIRAMHQDELKKLNDIKAAAENLIAQKGRHNTEIAYKRLEEALNQR